MGSDVLERFAPATRAWFDAAFAEPTPVQRAAWAAVLEGGNALVSAPTGSGKTLAAFLVAIDRLLTSPPAATTRVLYVSPLKALAYDIDRNLRAPLVGIGHAAQRLGVTVPEITVGMRTGDTSPEERRRLARQPPDVLITTPESLYLYLTSAARTTLAGVETVIVDEVHAVAGTKRGAHLALTLERLEALRRAGRPDAAPLQRIGLSATQRPLDEVARFLAGGEPTADGGWTPRPCTIVEVPSTKVLDVEVVVPVEDMAELGQPLEQPTVGPSAGLPGESRKSIWPSVHPVVLDLVEQHRSTIVFANSRRLAERLCARLNDLHAERHLAAHPDATEPPPPIAKAHHGSVAREQRTLIEEDLKAGRLRCVVATSSLELGIDMGAVDLVIQVESPGSVASGLQRIGRAGHQVGAPSVGKVFPKYRGDLVEAAVVVRRMLDGAIEETRYPRNPLDVLAQQVVAMAAMDPWPVAELHACVRRAAPFAELSRAQLDGVLDMLSGRYPSDEFAELRPRLTWDRVADTVTGRRGAQRIAVTSGGTIPDRGLYGVFLASGEGSRRVGELDEEMVYETRPGETVVLGASTWRIEDITRDQVLVVPAPGEPGKLPFWHGDTPSRPVEVGRAVGAFLREIATADDPAGTLQATYGLDPLAARNLVTYLGEQQAATRLLPSDTQIVVEQFRDEIGDWRICVLSPFGGRVHSPWALAIEARARERLGIEVSTMVSDDGIVIRLPDAVGGPGGFPGPWDPAWGPDPTAGAAPAWDGSAATLLDVLLPDPDEVEDLVVAELAGSALFASRFRECAARALLLPRRRPGGRTPLWQQRQKAADLLAVASRYGSFPIVLETYRECLRDVFDVPALQDLLRRVAARQVRVSHVETEMASPFSSSLLFDYIAGYMYEGDAPLAERRASALALDRELLAELIGADELRDLIDPAALADLELELQRLTDDRRARSADDVHDLLRVVGDLRTDEVAARTDGPAEAWLAELEAARRVYRARIAGEERWAAVEDAARLRDGLGVPIPVGLPATLQQSVDRPLVDLVARYARTHGPFVAGDVAARLGLPRDAVELALAALATEQRITAGEFRPGGSTREWCDTGVLRRLRRRSLATLRREVEPVEPQALGRFLPAWQGVGGRPGGVDRTFEVVEQLQGAAIPASVLEHDVLRARVPGYQPAWLDELLASGEVVWAGRGPLGSGDGKVALYLRDQAALLVPPPPLALGDATAAPDGDGDGPGWTDRHRALLDHLTTRGASFWADLYTAAGGGAPEEVVQLLWDLVWAGLVTNDSLHPLRALVGGVSSRPARGGRARRPGRVVTRAGPPAAAGRWSLVADLVAGHVPPTERATAITSALLARHGVLTRDAVTGEDLPGGFATAYSVLKRMEDAGRVRRGYFVEGLGGAQFALPGAVDRLRAERQGRAASGDPDAAPPVVVLAATDPANPYGAALPWPDPPDGVRQRPRRVAGAHVALVDGDLAVFAERGGRSLLAFTSDPAVLAVAAEGLAGLVDAGRVRALQVTRVDGADLADHPLVDALRAAGFADHPRGLVRR